VMRMCRPVPESILHHMGCSLALLFLAKQQMS